MQQFGALFFLCEPKVFKNNMLQKNPRIGGSRMLLMYMASRDGNLESPFSRDYKTPQTRVFVWFSTLIFRSTKCYL
jgi:hypothetical protein